MAKFDKNYKRNFSMGVINGALFNAALAFLSGSTILPVFISQLTESRILIGLFSTMESFGWFFPQLFAAVFIAHRPRVLGFYNNLSGLRLGFFAFAIAGIFFFADNPHSILISFVIFFGGLSIAAGFAGVAFTEIVGKTIPVNRRGSYFGLRMLIGGSLAALEGLLVKRIIATFDFPYNFGYLYISAWILMALGLATFAYVREPKTRDVIEKAHPREQFRAAISIFRKDSNFRRLYFTRACVNTYYLSSPFYVVFAITKLGATGSIAGIYLTMQMIGYLASNLLWAWLSNHISNKRVIMLSAAVSVIPPLLSLIAAFSPISPMAFATVFFLLGCAESGIGMGYVNYLLEILPEKGRLLSIGAMHTFIAPTVFFSALGGFLSQLFSIKLLFFIVVITTFISLLISMKLHEPRVRQLTPISPEMIAD
jgi:MFS family permease